MQDDKSLQNRATNNMQSNTHSKQTTDILLPTDSGAGAVAVPRAQQWPLPHCVPNRRGLRFDCNKKMYRAFCTVLTHRRCYIPLPTNPLAKLPVFLIAKAMLTSLLPWARHCLIPKEKVAIGHHVYWLTVGTFPVLSHNAGGNWHREKGQQVRRKGHHVRGDDGQLVWGERTERIPPRDQFVFLLFPPAKGCP